MARANDTFIVLPSPRENGRYVHPQNDSQLLLSKPQIFADFHNNSYQVTSSEANILKKKGTIVSLTSATSPTGLTFKFYTSEKNWKVDATFVVSIYGEADQMMKIASADTNTAFTSGAFVGYDKKGLPGEIIEEMAQEVEKASEATGTVEHQNLTFKRATLNESRNDATETSKSFKEDHHRAAFPTKSVSKETHEEKQHLKTKGEFDISRSVHLFNMNEEIKRANRRGQRRDTDTSVSPIDCNLKRNLTLSKMQDESCISKSGPAENEESFNSHAVNIEEGKHIGIALPFLESYGILTVGFDGGQFGAGLLLVLFVILLISFCIPVLSAPFVHENQKAVSGFEDVTLLKRVELQLRIEAELQGGVSDLQLEILRCFIFVFVCCCIQ